ncbi:MAG: (Fe-S)-binding protein [Bacteroidales bacterium]|nr:(Fe-S)-binding protein [Bacteroidales bacterium]
MEPITDDIRNKGLEVFRNIRDSKLLSHLNSCRHCGFCAESSIYYQVNPDAKFVPARKADLVSSVYRRYCTITGKYLPGLFGARELNQDTVEEMVDLLFGACTMCGRCTLHCSVGMDISDLVRTGRNMLSRMGYMPGTLQKTADAALGSCNNLDISTEEFTDTLKWLEEDLKYDLNDDQAVIPLNEYGRRILYTLNPREPKFFPLSISAMAKVFHAAGESWTLSTGMYDVTNYAYYSGNLDEARVIAQRLFDEKNPTGTDNLCCGGGGRQLAMSEYNERRISIAAMKPHQIRDTGAEIVVTPCRNCIDQPAQINLTYKLGAQIKTLSEIVADSLVLKEKDTDTHKASSPEL